MKYLLDTHTFLWSIAGTENLSKKVKSFIEDENNEIFVSAVSLWEISIKIRIGKLDLGKIKPEKIVELIQKMDFETVEMSPEEAATYYQLKESTHNDPFDRMLIWQAINRDMILLSKDRGFAKFKSFGLKLAW